MIRLTGVTVTARLHAGGRRTILDGVDMDIARGEWVALAGANGAGKTTLLKAIASLIPLAGGTIAFNGMVGPPRSVGMVLQEPDNQLITSSVRHELELSLAGTPREGRGNRLVQTTARFGLGGLWKRNPHRLSGGEKQRLALASVWLENPEVVLLDEPTAFLDPPMAQVCVEFVRAMRARGAVVVWTASSESELEHADSVAVLEHGALAFRGTGAEYRGWPGRAALALPDVPVRAATGALGNVDLVFDDVSLRYGDVGVFAGLNLVVHAGECVGVAGNNGSGKSSALLLAGGAIPPTGGRVTRRRAAAQGGGREDVFFLPQSPERMFFAETVEEELAFGLRRLRVGAAEGARRCRAALCEVGLDPDVFLLQSPFDLSPGEMRRVAFAVAMVLEPSLLLLDEPTAGLDAAGVSELHRLLARCRAAGTTVMIASHNERFLDACDRVVSLPDRASRG